MKRTRILPSTPKKVFSKKRVPHSPNTPLKQGKRKVEQKDSFCLCCGVCLIGAKSTFNACTCEGLLDKLRELIQTSINLNICSTRVCKPCYRKVYSLHTRSKVLQVDLEEFRSRFLNRTDDIAGDPESTTKSYFKRAAKASPFRQRKRNRNLSFENIPVLDWNVDEENFEQPRVPQDQDQDETVQTIRQTQDEFSVEVLIKEYC